MPHPLTFAKQHPVAVGVNMALGAIFLPKILGWINGTTGVGVSLPSYGGS